MDLKSVSTELLLKELEERNKSVSKREEKAFTALGTLVKNANEEYIEVFKLIKVEKDLNFLNSYNLRIRFNSQRTFKWFYFKVNETEFKQLNLNLEANQDSFIEWLKSSKSIQWKVSL